LHSFTHSPSHADAVVPGLNIALHAIDEAPTLAGVSAALAAVDAHQQLQSDLLLNIAQAVQDLGNGLASVKRGPDLGALMERLERLEGTVQWNARVASRTGEGAPIRVLFLVHHATAWPAIRDIVDEMLQADDFEPVVMSLPHHFPLVNRLGGEAEVHAMLQQQGYKHIRLRDDDAGSALDYVKSLAPAVVFRQAPWDNDLPATLSSKHLAFARLCYVPYGYMTAAIETKQFDQAWHRQCWRLFCPDEAHRALYAAHNALGDINCRVTGYPKFDHLSRQVGQAGLWPIRGGRADACRVIWAPHFSSDNDPLKFGVFNRIAADMLTMAAGNPSVEIVLRPHPALREAMANARPDSALARFLAAWKALPNACLDDEADYAELFAASHAMLTDGISFFSEYQLFDKPLVYFERADNVGFNAAGERLKDGMYCVRDFAEWTRRLQEFRAGVEDPAIVAARRRIAAELQPFPGAAARQIVEVIRREIGAS
jgi:CDP-Glycerol:Poly(glycerophosphate) glycerophosphotransferase